MVSKGLESQTNEAAKRKTRWLPRKAKEQVWAKAEICSQPWLQSKSTCRSWASLACIASSKDARVVRYWRRDWRILHSRHARNPDREDKIQRFYRISQLVRIEPANANLNEIIRAKGSERIGEAYSWLGDRCRLRRGRGFRHTVSKVWLDGSPPNKTWDSRGQSEKARQETRQGSEAENLWSRKWMLDLPSILDTDLDSSV